MLFVGTTGFLPLIAEEKVCMMFHHNARRRNIATLALLQRLPLAPSAPVNDAKPLHCLDYFHSSPVIYAALHVLLIGTMHSVTFALRVFSMLTALAVHMFVMVSQRAAAVGDVTVDVDGGCKWSALGDRVLFRCESAIIPPIKLA